jgi:hypothetical protein
MGGGRRIGQGGLAGGAGVERLHGRAGSEVRAGGGKYALSVGGGVTRSNRRKIT